MKRKFNDGLMWGRPIGYWIALILFIVTIVATYLS